jgi:hypothetical protein
LTLPGFAVAVLEQDIFDWIEAIAPRISPLRRARYAKDYNVADKIRRAKASGNWPPCPFTG